MPRQNSAPLNPSAMYIKLRYRARLAQPAQIHELISEVEDICQSHGWPYRVWGEDWQQPADVSGEFADGAINFKGHAPLKGVTFQIGDSETVWLTFQADGVLQSLMTLAEPTFTADDEYFPWQRVKTGLDGGKTHLALALGQAANSKISPHRKFGLLDENFFEPRDVILLVK